MATEVAKSDNVATISPNRKSREENPRTARKGRRARRNRAACAWACKAAAARACLTRCVSTLKPRDRDKIFEEYGARFFVDPKSFLYLERHDAGYEETLMRQGFVFQNPNAARSCGCGSSFTA